MVFRAACLQHIKVFLFKIRQPALVGGIKRVHQTIAKGIGIDIERRMHEMRDIGPKGLVSIHEIKDFTQGLRLHRHPERVDVIGRQLAFGAGGVQFAFKVIKGDLAHHGVDHVFDLARQQGLALGLGLGAVQQLAEGQHLAKHRCGFGQGQRCGRKQFALACRQHLMHAVAKFMRKRHHIARLAQIVQHHIGVHRGHGRMRKSPRCLAGFDACVNPALGEEGLGNLGQARVKGGIGRKHGLARLGPIHQARRFNRQGRVAVPDLQGFKPHPFRL